MPYPRLLAVCQSAVRALAGAALVATAAAAVVHRDAAAQAPECPEPQVPYNGQCVTPGQTCSINNDGVLDGVSGVTVGTCVTPGQKCADSRWFNVGSGCFFGQDAPQSGFKESGDTGNPGRLCNYANTGSITWCAELFGPDYQFPIREDGVGKNYIYNCDPNIQTGLQPATYNTTGAEECACDSRSTFDEQRGFCACNDPADFFRKDGLCGQCEGDNVTFGPACVTPAEKCQRNGFVPSGDICQLGGFQITNAAAADPPAASCALGGSCQAAFGENLDFPPNDGGRRAFVYNCDPDAAAGLIPATANRDGRSQCVCAEPTHVMANNRCVAECPGTQVVVAGECMDECPPGQIDYDGVCAAPADQCEALGGRVLNPDIPGERVCQNVDRVQTFCLLDSTAALPCRGLLKHAAFCHGLRRPALNPFLCRPTCPGEQQPWAGDCRTPPLALTEEFAKYPPDDLRIIAALTMGTADPNEVINERPALLAAAAEGRAELLAALLRAGADVNAADPDGHSVPFILFAAANRPTGWTPALAVMSVFVENENGFNWKATDNSGRRILDAASAAYEDLPADADNDRAALLEMAGLARDAARARDQNDDEQCALSSSNSRVCLGGFGDEVATPALANAALQREVVAPQPELALIDAALVEGDADHRFTAATMILIPDRVPAATNIPTGTPLLIAAGVAGNAAVVRLLLSRGAADPNATGTIGGPDFSLPFVLLENDVSQNDSTPRTNWPAARQVMETFAAEQNGYDWTAAANGLRLLDYAVTRYGGAALADDDARRHYEVMFDLARNGARANNPADNREDNQCGQRGEPLTNPDDFRVCYGPTPTAAPPQPQVVHYASGPSRGNFYAFAPNDVTRVSLQFNANHGGGPPQIHLNWGVTLFELQRRSATLAFDPVGNNRCRAVGADAVTYLVTTTLLLPVTVLTHRGGGQWTAADPRPLGRAGELTCYQYRLRGVNAFGPGVYTGWEPSFNGIEVFSPRPDGWREDLDLTQNPQHTVEPSNTWLVQIREAENLPALPNDGTEDGVWMLMEMHLVSNVPNFRDLTAADFEIQRRNTERRGADGSGGCVAGSYPRDWYPANPRGLRRGGVAWRFVDEVSVRGQVYCYRYRMRVKNGLTGPNDEEWTEYPADDQTHIKIDARTPNTPSAPITND